MTAMNTAEHARINALVYQFAQTYLEKRGWFESLDGIPRNKEGLVPWITYPAFRQLQRTVKPDAKVFEFGCGGSSLWWASHAAEVTSVEHDADWAARVAAAAPANLKIITRVMDESCSAERQAMVTQFFANPPQLPVSPDAGHNIMHGLLCREFVGLCDRNLRLRKAKFRCDRGRRHGARAYGMACGAVCQAARRYRLRQYRSLAI